MVPIQNGPKRWWNMYFEHETWILVQFYVLRRIIIIIFQWRRNVWTLVFNYYLLCRREGNQFDVHFWRIRFVLSPSKIGKDAAFEGRNGWKSVYLPPGSASFVFVVNMIKVLFPSCTLTWRVNNYISLQEKV